MELLTQWLPSQPWCKENGSTNLRRVGSFRFDDPEGEVGIETLLVASESAVFQVPLTYRGSQLQGADPCLIGTMEHSFLGKRWIYDATGDPVYASTLAAAILTGQPQADQFFEVDGRLELLAESVHLESTGTLETRVPIVCSAVPDTVDGVTTIETGELALSVVRVLNLCGRPFGRRILSATWDEQTSPVQLASVVRVS
jgi:hypothetical protein